MFILVLCERCDSVGAETRIVLEPCIPDCGDPVGGSVTLLDGCGVRGRLSTITVVADCEMDEVVDCPGRLADDVADVG